MEQEPPDFYERVRQAYRKLAGREKHRVVLVDGTRPQDEIEKNIWEVIASRFPGLASNNAPNPKSGAHTRSARTTPQ
jgi:dTMP kinase